MEDEIKEGDRVQVAIFPGGTIHYGTVMHITTPRVLSLVIVDGRDEILCCFTNGLIKVDDSTNECHNDGE